MSAQNKSSKDTSAFDEFRHFISFTAFIKIRNYKLSNIYYVQWNVAYT